MKTSTYFKALFLAKGIKIHMACIAFFLLFLTLSKSYSQTWPSTFNHVLVSNGWNEVEGFRFDATGQTYVWERTGVIWVVDTNGVKLATPLLNISDEVGGWRDHGLNGFALDPNFRTNGYYYLFYTVDRHYLMNFGTGNYNAATNTYFAATIARVTRYTANPTTNFTTTIAGSRLILLGENKKTGIPVLHESHSGGQLVFGTDGSLMLTTGDGASYNVADGGSSSDTYWSQGLTDTIIKTKENVGAFRSQLVDCFNGKVLRINPANGDGLPTNPFYDPANPRSAKSRVWCTGLRNPFRMCLRPGTGSTDITAGNPGVLYIGDVGWGTWEDLHVAKTGGLNFGWPLFEGLTVHSGYQGMTVYNLDAPNPLFGTGGCTQQYLQFKQLLVQATLAAPSWPNPCNAGQQIPASIPRFMHTRPPIEWKHGANQARTGIWSGNNAAEINLDNISSPVPGPVFAGNASVGGSWYLGTKYPLVYQNTYFNADFGQGWIRNFKFDVNDDPDSVKNFGNSVGAVVYVEYNPKDQNLYYVKYGGEIYKIIYNGTVNNPPAAIASQNILYGPGPLTVNFTGSNSTDPESLPLTYSWNFGDGTSNSSSANPSHTFNPPNSNPITYTVNLTVTDNIGQVSTTTLKVYANNTPPQVTITSFNDGDLFTMSHITFLPLQANVFDAEHGPGQLTYMWQTYLHHNNHEHPEAPDNNPITSTVITPVGCDTPNVYYYRIQLTVTDAAGLSTVVSSSIYPACDPPDAFFSVDTNKVCKGGTINFTDHSTNLPDSWEWLFPGGTPTSSALENPSVVYSTSGTYDVSLVVTSTRGADTLLMPGVITVYNLPAATISPAGNDSVCSGTVVLLTANSAANLVYQWIRNNTDISGATGVTYNATSTGNYKVRVIRTTTGCTKTSSIKKIVYRQISALITPDGPTTFCNGDDVVLSAPNVAGYTYVWKKNGVIISGANGNNYTAATTGLYRVVVTDVFSCSKTSIGVQVTVNCRLADESVAGVFGDEFNSEIYPNPVQKMVTLSIFMPMAEKINVQIYDAIGRQVESVVENFVAEEGENLIDIDASQFTPGIYFLKVSSFDYIKTHKMIVQNRE